MKTVAHALRPEWYSVKVRAKTLGPGVGPAFTWVRDQVRFEAYSGVLRDAEGTLAAGAGNAFDRSLLLSRLLNANGIQTRFVTGDLPRPQADVLFEHMFDANEASASPNDAAGAKGGAGFLSRVTARATRDQPVILKALGPSYPAGAARSREQAITDIQRHVWLQASVDGRWLDLDSSFRDAEPGKTYCPATQTLDALPPASYQTVTIRVGAERVEDGTLSSAQALEVTRPAADLVNRRVFLVHVPAPASGGIGLGAGQAHGDRWAPALLIDERLEVGRPVDFGDIDAGAGFDALSGGGTSAFVAEWLEFEVARPDGRRDVSRRTLVDRGGAAWRATSDHPVASLRPLPHGERELLDPGAVHHIMFSAGPHNLRRYGRAVVTAAFRGLIKPDAKPSVSSTLRSIAARDAATLVWADDVIVPSLNDNPQVRVFGDAPRIAIVSLTPDQRGGFTETYDLRRDSINVVARTSAADALAASRRIWFAAFEGALEHECVARDSVMGGADPSTVLSTSALVTPEGVVALGVADLARLPELSKDAETRARLGAILRGGSIAVVPRSVFASQVRGWWEVSPNGDIRGVLGDLDGSFNSGFGVKPITTPADAPRIDIGPEMSQEEIAQAQQEAMDEFMAGEEGAEGAEGAEAAEVAAAPKEGGNEYQVTLIKVAQVAIVVGIVAGLYWHHVSKVEADALYDAWSAAEDAKQQRALRAARGGGAR